MPHKATIATKIWKYVVAFATNIWEYVGVFAPKIWRYGSHLLGVILTGLVFAIISGLLAQKTSDLPGLVLINILHWFQLGGTLQRVIETVLAILFLIFFLSGIVTFIQELWQSQQSQVPARLEKNMRVFTEEQWEELLTKRGVTAADQLEGSNRHAKIHTLIHNAEEGGWLDQLQDAVKEVIAEKIRADKEKIDQFLGEIVSEQNCNELIERGNELIERGEELLSLHPDFSDIRAKTAQAYNQCAQLASSDRKKEIHLLSRAIQLVEQAEFLARRGAANALEGNFELALSDCDRAVQMGPRQAENYYCRAIVYREKEDYTQAIKDITCAIELDSSKAIYYYERCLFHRKLGKSQQELGNIGQALDNIKQALDDIKQAIMLYPKQGIDYQALLGIEQYYQVLIELEPQQSENYKLLGVFHKNKLFDHEKAIADFTHAIDLNPQVANYYSLRSRSYSSIHNYDEAIQDLTKAIDLNPGCIDYYQRRGKIYREHQDYEKAIADFKEAINLDPQVVGNYWSCANCYEDRDGNVQSANEYYRRAAEIDAQKTGELYWDRGCDFIVRDNDRAISDFTCAIELNPLDARSYSHRAKSYLSKGELRKWLEDAIQAVKLAPELADNVYSAYYYDWQHRSDSRRDSTIAQDEYLYLLIDSFRQQQGPFHYIRGRKYKDNGEQELAKQDFQQAAQLGFPDAQEQLDKLNS